MLVAVSASARGRAGHALRQTADKTAADWDTLAKGLEPKIARLLPCDPDSRAAVEEVSHASDARLAALAAYLKAAAAKAKMDTEAAKRVLAAQAALAGGWNTERTEADQQGAAIEAQVADLKESMRKRGSLAGAEQVLAEIARMVKERASKSADLAARKDVDQRVAGRPGGGLPGPRRRRSKEKRRNWTSRAPAGAPIIAPAWRARRWNAPSSIPAAPRKKVP